MTMSLAEHICTHCGACCAYFRVSFYWSEGSGLPDELKEALTPVYDCMAGTNQKNPRCQALEGQVGSKVSCSVYPNRTSPCKEVMPGDEKCLKARAAHGLPDLVFVPSSNDDEHHDQAS